MIRVIIFPLVYINIFAFRVCAVEFLNKKQCYGKIVYYSFRNIKIPFLFYMKIYIFMKKKWLNYNYLNEVKTNQLHLFANKIH